MLTNTYWFKTFNHSETHWTKPVLSNADVNQPIIFHWLQQEITTNGVWILSHNQQKQLNPPEHQGPPALMCLRATVHHCYWIPSPGTCLLTLLSMHNNAFTCSYIILSRILIYLRQGCPNYGPQIDLLRLAACLSFCPATRFVFYNEPPHDGSTSVLSWHYEPKRFRGSSAPDLRTMITLTCSQWWSTMTYGLCFLKGLLMVLVATAANRDHVGDSKQGARPCLCCRSNR